MNTEPVAIIGTITAAVSAAFALLVAFGIDISDDQQKAILAAIAAIAPLVVILSRQFVTPTDKANDAIREASLQMPGETPPLIK